MGVPFALRWLGARSPPEVMGLQPELWAPSWQLRSLFAASWHRPGSSLQLGAVGGAGAPLP